MGDNASGYYLRAYRSVICWLLWLVSIICWSFLSIKNYKFSLSTTWNHNNLVKILLFNFLVNDWNISIDHNNHLEGRAILDPMRNLAVQVQKFTTIHIFKCALFERASVTLQQFHKELKPAYLWVVVTGGRFSWIYIKMYRKNLL